MDTTTMRSHGAPRTTDAIPRDPVFDPDRSSTARAIGRRMADHRPVLAGLVVEIVGILVMAAVIVGLGLLLTHFLLPDGVARIDGSVSRWFVRQRTGTFDSVTWVGSALGSTPVIVGLALLAVIAMAIGRHWRQIGFLVGALAIEFSVFLTATALVDRNRPSVPRLDATPVTSSYPSGHTAAALTLYAGLAIVAWSLARGTGTRVLAWILSILAVALPIFVGVSRLYRGMHHLTDVLASVLLGCGAVLFALLATRSAVAVSEAPDVQPVQPASERPIEVTS
jgi:membrane-associated phospholipid phosphatase